MKDEYFQLYVDHFWEWSDGGEVVSIVKGNTVVYRPLLIDIINTLSDHGLPRFEPLLLVLIALNPNARTDLEFVNEKKAKIIGNDLYHEEAAKFLSKLIDLPLSYKTGNNKLLVLKTVFEKSHLQIGFKDSEIIAFGFEHDFEISPIVSNPEEHKKILKNSTKILGLLNRKFESTDSIISKIANVPDLKEDVGLEEDVNLKPEELVKELIDNPQTHKVGSLVKTLWSGLNLPVHSASVKSEQPIGGVSDLTNKGSYDRLLISEYANDDMLFLSRLANNEALFLNREAPPTKNKLKRVILIDASLKNWGTPKLMSFATLLAIAKHPKTDILCEAYVVGRNFQQIQFDSVHGVIHALQHAIPSIDASIGIEHFFETFPANKNRELFILTEKSTLKYDGMVKVMNEFKTSIDYWILNEANGGVDIYKNTSKSKKHIQHLEIQLERLWTRPKPEIVENNLKYYPILVPQPVKFIDIRPTENGEVFMLTKSRKLMRFYGRNSKSNEKGWRLVEDNLPKYIQQFEIGLLRDGTYVLLMYGRKKHKVHIINLNTKSHIEREHVESYGFTFDDDRFYHYAGNEEWEVHVNGRFNKIENREFEVKSVITSRGKKINDCKNLFTNKKGIFKNIRAVGINTNGQLMLNTHALNIMNSELRFRHVKSDAKYEILARSSDDFIFKFPDGSTVKNDKNGMMILKSSNTKIPHIYVPLVLKKGLGVATRTEFAGNLFFYEEPTFRVKIIKNSRKNNLALVKILKELTGLGLKHCKEMVDESFKSVVDLAILFSESEAYAAKQRLDGLGATVEIEAVDSDRVRQETIHIEQFYEDHIKEFIHNIQAYGAQD